MVPGSTPNPSINPSDDYPLPHLQIEGQQFPSLSYDSGSDSSGEWCTFPPKATCCCSLSSPYEMTLCSQMPTYYPTVDYSTYLPTRGGIESTISEFIFGGNVPSEFCDRSTSSGVASSPLEQTHRVDARHRNSGQPRWNDYNLKSCYDCCDWASCHLLSGRDHFEKYCEDSDTDSCRRSIMQSLSDCGYNVSEQGDYEGPMTPKSQTQDHGMPYSGHLIEEQFANDAQSTAGSYQDASPAALKRRSFRKRPSTCSPEPPSCEIECRMGIKDVFLIQAKLAGKSYKQIRLEGGFREAESTLRGRYRNLTKKRHDRVRRPTWGDNDVCVGLSAHARDTY